MNLQQLKNYLDEQNLIERYTSKEKPSVFETFTTSHGIQRQTSWSSLQLDSRSWIDYDMNQDQFIFKTSYFTHDGNNITREEFNSILPQYPIGLYGTEDNIIKWVKYDDMYNIQYATNIIIKLPITTISVIG